MRIAKTEVRVKTMHIGKARNLAILNLNSILNLEGRIATVEHLIVVFRNSRISVIIVGVVIAQETVVSETHGMVKTVIGMDNPVNGLAERNIL